MAEGPKTPMSARRKARKRALDVLYEADLRDAAILDTLTAAVARTEPPRPPYLDYTVTLVEGVAAHLDRIDELIASYAEGWTLERMPPVDRNLARIAVYELLYAEDIDDPVAISEAVELARQLSTDDSPRFLTGLWPRSPRYPAGWGPGGPLSVGSTNDYWNIARGSVTTIPASVSFSTSPVGDESYTMASARRSS